MEKLIKILPVLILAITVVIALSMVLPRIDRYLDIKAVEACSNSSKFVQENSQESFTAQYPLKELYETCLSETK